jgi:hypothetical protein
VHNTVATINEPQRCDQHRAALTTPRYKEQGMAEQQPILAQAAHQQPEVWKAIKGFEGAYEVSSLGRVRSLDRDIPTRYGTLATRKGRILKTRGSRYHLAILSVDKTKSARYVHDLVLEAFVGPRLDGMQARHYPDRNTNNNAVDNLQWGTPSENCADKVIHGTALRGERNHKCKIPDSAIPVILARLSAGEPATRIARDYGVSYTPIYNIRDRRRVAAVLTNAQPLSQ